MGFSGKITLKNESELLFWELTESIDELCLALNPAQISAVNKFSNSSKRKKERLGVFSLLNEQFPEQFPLISYKDSGQPFLNSVSKSISISHSGKFVVLMVSEEVCGVDIQEFKSNIEKGLDLFINSSDNVTSDQKRDLTLLHKLWGAKEALFKKYEGKLDFKTEITFLGFAESSDAMRFSVCLDEQHSVNERVICEMYNELFLVFC